jgi:hypothetical protein
MNVRIEPLEVCHNDNAPFGLYTSDSRLMDDIIHLELTKLFRRQDAKTTSRL